MKLESFSKLDSSHLVGFVGRRLDHLLKAAFFIVPAFQVGSLIEMAPTIEAQRKQMANPRAEPFSYHDPPILV